MLYFQTVLVTMKVGLYVYNCPNHVNTNRTHTQSCKHCRTSFNTNVQWSIPSVSLLAFNTKWSHRGSCFTMLSQWPVLSCFQSMLNVWSQFRSSHKFTCLSHLGIFLKIYLNEQHPFTRPQLSCTAQSQPLVVLLYFLELLNAWGCPLG